jgi:hypothetical protein
MDSILTPSMTMEAYGILVSRTETEMEYTVVISYTVDSWGRGGDADTSVIRFGIQLNDQACSMLTNHTVNTTPIGSTGIVFLTKVFLPVEFASTWKIQGYLLNQASRQTFISIPGHRLPIFGPWCIAPADARCPSFTKPGGILGYDSLTGKLADLPDVGTNAVSTVPTVGRVYYPSFTPTPSVHPIPPWLNESRKLLNFWEKINGYAVSGFVRDIAVSQADLRIVSSPPSLQFVTNAVPCHPVGIFPVPHTDACLVYDPESSPSALVPQALQFNLPLNPSVNSVPTAAFSGPIGFFLDNSMVYAPVSSDGLDPETYKCSDYYEARVDAGGVYHRNAFSLMLNGFTIDSTLRVVGFMCDGFPIVAPFQAHLGGVYRPVQTKDLDVCHGFASPIQFTLNDQSLSYNYFYVCTLDFPYLFSAFRGTPSPPTTL